MLAATETRQTFANLAHWEIVFWYCLIAVSTAIFAWGLLRLLLRYRRARGGLSIPDKPVTRVWRTSLIVLTHAWIKRRDGVAGLAHAATFYGFMVLFAGTVILGFQDDFAKPVLDFDFFHDEFYLVYSLFLDIFGFALLAGLAVFAVKRLRKPFRLDYTRPDRDQDRRGYVIGDWSFLAILLFLGVTGFLLEAFRIAETNPSFETWSPLGWSVAQGLRAAGLTGGLATSAHTTQWWVHGVAALGFVSSIPYTKAVHIFSGPANVLVRDEQAGKRLPLLPPDPKPEEVGYARITDLTWEHLVSLDACTKCGKCHAACPATAGGYPLSPRDVILDLREVAGEEGAIAEGRSILGDPIRPETLWSCMQCMACVEICPVGIEHVPIINQMRRQLVERGDLDPMLQQTFETIYETGNSFGEPKRKRARWAKELGFEVKDIRKEPAELLWFVGDYASFDPRNQRATRALAQVLHEVGVDFGILWDAERTGGCDVRRAGEEGLWLSLAEENVKTISGCDFERIFSSDPHTFHTLRNEYPDLGGDWTVLHHSQLLLELIDAGQLVPAKQLGHRVTYHDPCTLGRYNGVYDEPRQVLAALGVELREMGRSRDNSFCCGAGGGRIWMKELAREGSRRPSEQRIDEAVGLGELDYFVVACPKDVTMYEDAIKTSGHQGEIELRELSELVLESLELPPPAPAAAEAEEVAGA
jgi:Fe-S oxidoreductase/nitrate reductase gamma subunit